MEPRGVRDRCGDESVLGDKIRGTETDKFLGIIGRKSDVDFFHGDGTIMFLVEMAKWSINLLSRMTMWLGTQKYSKALWDKLIRQQFYHENE